MSYPSPNFQITIDFAKWEFNIKDSSVTKFVKVEDKYVIMFSAYDGEAVVYIHTMSRQDGRTSVVLVYSIVDDSIRTKQFECITKDLEACINNVLLTL